MLYVYVSLYKHLVFKKNFYGSIYPWAPLASEMILIGYSFWVQSLALTIQDTYDASSTLCDMLVCAVDSTVYCMTTTV